MDSYGIVYSFGYAIPAVLSIIMIAVGETVQNCQKHGPNFGNGRCWFGGNCN